MTQAVALAQQASTGVSPGFRNRIINGAMVISQRNGTSSVNAADGQYFTDRFVCADSVDNKFTGQQSSTAPAGFSNSLLLTSSSAYSVSSTDYFLLNQNIEGFNVADLGWGTASAKTVTLSFWVQSSLTGTFGGVLNNSANDRSYAYTYTISAANTWEYKSVTIAGDTTGTWVTNNGLGLRVRWSLGAGSTRSTSAGSWQAGLYLSATGATSVVATNGATFYITGVQLEVGSTATSFDYRPYGTELNLCQRYFVKYCGNANYEYVPYATCIAVNSTQAYGNLSFPQQMRSLPSISGSNLRFTNESAGYAITSIIGSGAVYGSQWQTEIYVVSTGLSTSLPLFIQANNSTSAYVYLSAEL
jgi:hypothetical protein